MAKTTTTADKCLILAATPYTLSQSDFSGYDETLIFTNDCYFAPSDSNTITAKAFSLHASHFKVLSQDATISTSGKPGSPNQFLADTSADGKDARPLALSAFKLEGRGSKDLSDVQALIILANGGDGGEGYIEAGPGGNGGNGGIVSLLFNDIYQSAVFDLRYVRTTPDGPIDRRELGIWLFIQAKSQFQSSDVVNEVTALMSNYAGMSDTELAEAVQDLEDQMIAQSNILSQKVSVDVSGGEYGVGGQGKAPLKLGEKPNSTPKPGPDGISGNPGHFSERKMVSTTIRESSDCLFHPEQVAMTVREVENLYFCGTQDALDACQQYLSSLITRLNFLDALLPSDPQYMAYAEHEADMFVAPSGTAEPTSIMTLNSSYKIAKQYANQLQRGLDFYGKDATWVPGGSIDFYRTNLESALSNFKDVETGYLLYQTQAKDKLLRDSNLTIAKTSARITRDQAADEMAALIKEANATGATIAAMQEGLPAMHAALDKALKDDEDKIKNNFSVSFSDFISAAGQFAFAPGIPMGVIQGAGLLNTAINQVTDDSGLKVEKAYVISQLVQLTAGMDGLKEGVNFVQGEMRMDDPGASKLIGSEGDIMDLVSKYRGLLGDDTIKSLLSTFNDYIAAVLQRNGLVLHYNACINLFLTARATNIESQAKMDTLSKAQLTESSPSLPAMAVAVEKSYFSTTTVILRLLYDTSRALAFYSLSGSNPTLLSNIRTPGFPGTDLSSSLTDARDKLIGAYVTSVEEFSSARQEFGKTDTSDLEPIKFVLTDAQLKSLCTVSRNTYGIILSIPEAYPETQRDDNPFAGCADVRVSRIRFYLKGAKTKDNSLTVSLTHLGQSSVVDSTGLRHRFSQQSKAFKFQYNLKNGKITTDGDIVSVINKEYALPSPFAAWRVEISQSWNSSVDLSKVTSAWFEFSGISRVFG